MKKRILYLCLSLLLYASLGTTLLAQTPSFEGTLIYVRDTGSAVEFVRLSSSARQVYILPSDMCTALSTQGTYIAQSSSTESDLVVRCLDTQEVIVQTPWLPEWEPCRIFWLSDTAFSIGQQGTTQEFFDFDISTGSLVPFTFVLPDPQYPPLPDWMPDTQNDFILPSPNPNIFLYERCNGQETVGEGQIRYCASSPDFVIYDVAQQSVIHVLENTNEVSITGRDTRRRIAYGSASWSATGRYLAFERTFIPGDLFELRVYDVQTTQYLDISFYNIELDSEKAMQWSPQGNILAFWVVGRLDDPELNIGEPTLFRHLVIFDADTGQFTIADQPTEVNFGTEQWGTWSPDGQAFAFVDRNGNLTHADADTGETTTLDDHVEFIVVWR